MLLKIVTQCLAHGSLYRTYHFVIAKFGFGLTLKLRLHHLYRNHGGKTLTEVIARYIYLHLFKHLIVFGILFKGRSQATTETGEMGTTLYGVDIIHERVHILIVCGIVCQRHLHRYTLTFGIEMYHIVDKRFFIGIDIFNKLTQTILGIEHLAARLTVFVYLTHILKGKGDTRI